MLVTTLVVAFVVAVKVAVVAPFETVTDVGTTTVAETELERLTTNPELPAAAVRVTVPVLELPANTVVGLIATLETDWAKPIDAKNAITKHKRSLLAKVGKAKNFLPSTIDLAQWSNSCGWAGAS